MQKTSAFDFIILGAWPCTSDLTRATTFVDERVLSHYAALKDAAPSLSTRAFLEGLATTSLAYGGTVGHRRLLSARNVSSALGSQISACSLTDTMTIICSGLVRVKASIRPPLPIATWSGGPRSWTSGFMSRQSTIWSVLPAIHSRICFTSMQI